MATSSSAAARSSQLPRGNCEVFLSFRGPDSRNSFTSHLYEALINREIITFRDDKKLEHGAPISRGLLKAIEESSVAVIILSANYASSRWCLDELVKIMECKVERGQTVMPVFYGVEPSTIRHQKRSFDEAFRQHEARYGDDVEGMHKVQRWRTALVAVAELRGYDTRQGTEAEIIKQIVNQISFILCKSISGKNLQLLNKLKTKLPALQCLLNDEEITQPFSPNPPQWLDELQGTVDRAENLVEEVNYEVLRIKVEGKHQDIAELSNHHISDLYSCLSDDFFLSIKERLEHVIETLEELQKQIGDLGQILIKSSLDRGKRGTRSPSTCIVDESDILGRKKEIEELVDRLLSADANGKIMSVIPILGMAGVGKTTLAQVVYNNESVEAHFDLKTWFCVSEPYDLLAITKGLLQEIGLFDLKDDNNLNQLQIKLRNSLKGKKFLIVLDDVWNDNSNDWDDLRKLFVQGKAGSKIIVTTRKESVVKTMGNNSSMMGSGVINVGTLSCEVSWALFKWQSLENRDPDKCPELEEVGRQIANKCKGLPLAIKAVAGVLRSKLEIEEWRDILRSETWEISSHSNGILPALMLSYNDLPAHLKCCFSYCAIFPKDYPFCKEQVIFLWIANGLAQCLRSGKQYFVELTSRSLFKRVLKSSEGQVEKFLMHDLVNDLAQIASSKRCLRLEDNEGSHLLEQSRHLSYSMGNGEFKKLKPLYKLEQLKTLLPVSSHTGYSFALSKRVLYNVLPKLTSLRTLSLSGYNIMELPNKLFIKLKLLRFLDLSQTKIKRLPDSICELYNLETLLLSRCENLEEFPPQMEELINLRHLDISSTSLLKKSLALSKLKSLHVLLGVNFFLGGCSDSRIEDLDELHILYGSLSISELQHVVDGREALKAKLRKKEHVEELSLEWSGGSVESLQNERNILDELRPNRNIKKLNIKGYRGTSFPDWLADEVFLKLVTLSLSNCKDCYSLPALGQLPSLKFLSVGEMDGITIVGEEFYGKSSSKKPFNSLEKLKFTVMPEWKEWHAPGIGEFPLLRELSIDDCPLLIGNLPENLCSLMKLKISKCPQLILDTNIQLSSLKKLDVKDCDSLTSLPFRSQPSTLKEIRMCRCGKLKFEFSVSEVMYTACNLFLDRLELEECDSIDVISNELIPRARTLIVVNCHNLTRLLIPSGTEDLDISGCENLETLSVLCKSQMTLHSLYITDCKKLRSLLEGMQELPPSLKKLTLAFCPEIESFPEEGLPFNLEALSIRHCMKLVNGRKEWHLQPLSSLRELSIYHDGSDKEIVGDENWELPCSIQRLFIAKLKTLSIHTLKSLTSLEYVETCQLPQIKSLIEGLPISISTLMLTFHMELRSLPAEGLRRLTSLQLLEIGSCKRLKTLPESALPCSLSELRIMFCENLQSLGKSMLPSSLSKLEISCCPNLQSLPVKGMPSSMSHVYIYDCPLLIPLLDFDKGDYWPKISHIPTIIINEEFL